MKQVSIFSEKKLALKPESNPNKKVETRKPTRTRKKLIFKPEPDPTRPDPTRPDPTRPDPTRPDPTRPDPTRPDPISGLSRVG